MPGTTRHLCGCDVPLPRQDRALRYEFRYAVDGGPEVQLEVGPSGTSPARITLPVPLGRINWWFIDRHTAPCPPGRSSIYGFDHEIKGRQRAVRR